MGSGFATALQRRYSLDAFAVQRDVQPLALLFLRHAEPDRDVDDFQEHETHDKPIGHVVPTANNWAITDPLAPLISLLAKTPVSNAPMIPPMP